MPCKPLKSINKCIQKNFKDKNKKLLQEFRGLIVEVRRLKRLFKKIKKAFNKSYFNIFIWQVQFGRYKKFKV